MQFLFSCSTEDEQYVKITGTLRNQTTQHPIYPAYIFLDNEPVAMSDSTGRYETKPILPGTYSLVFSAVNYNDKTIQVEVSANDNNVFEIFLNSDYRTGKVYGEFHDKGLFDENLALNPEKADWSAEQLYDGISGATIQPWNWSFAITNCQIKMGDSIVSQADDYGQFAFNLQGGTYPFTAICDGYNDTTFVLTIESDDKVYSNIMLSRNASE